MQLLRDEITLDQYLVKVNRTWNENLFKDTVDLGRQSLGDNGESGCPTCPS